MQPPSEEYNWHQPHELIEILKDEKNLSQAIDSNIFNKYFNEIDQFSSTKIAKEIEALIHKTETNYKNNYIAFFNIHGLKFIFKYFINYFACNTKFNFKKNLKK